MWATLTRPQNRTSNFLAKVVGDTVKVDATELFEGRDEKLRLVSDGSVPPEPVEVLLEMVTTSLLRAELFPACLSVLMISGTSRDNKKEIRNSKHCDIIH